MFFKVKFLTIGIAIIKDTFGWIRSDRLIFRDKSVVSKADVEREDSKELRANSDADRIGVGRK